MKRALFILLMMVMTTAVVAACGCGEKSAETWLEDCRQAASEYFQDGNYLHFTEVIDYGFEGQLEGQSYEFTQQINIEGDAIFVDRQRYDHRETMSSPQVPEGTQENSFSYLTVDGGTTAFVEGERLSTQLGVTGWVHYTPSAEENRYFDYGQFINTLTGTHGDLELVGYEDVHGTPCAHLRYTVSGEELMQLRFQQDPSLEEKYSELDLGEYMEDMNMELWVGEEDDLPRRIMVGQTLSQEGEGTADVGILMEFAGYGQEPPILIEEPAFFTEAG
jgi:hypothetical protein